MTITRREFIKKGGILAGAGVIGAAIVPVAAEAAPVTEVTKPSMPAKSAVASSGKRALSPSETWAMIPDEVKVKLTVDNLRSATMECHYAPYYDEVTVSLEFSWADYQMDPHRMKCGEPLD